MVASRFIHHANIVKQQQNKTPGLEYPGVVIPDHLYICNSKLFENVKSQRQKYLNFVQKILATSIVIYGF
jgi:hypothetical protein